MNGIKPAQLFPPGQIPATPFELELGPDTLVVEQLLRVLPGKRLVVKARCRHELLLVKIFREKHSYQKELAGYDALHAANINTPKRLGYGELAQGAYCFYQYVEKLLPLKMVFDQGNTEEKSHHLRRLLDLLGTMYNGGVCQRDLHLDNFAYEGDTLLALDAASCTTMTGSAGQKENLALLLAQLPPKDWPWALDMMAQKFPQIGTETLLGSGRQSWKKRLQNFLKKIYRECTYVKCWSRKLGPLQRLDIYCVRQDCSAKMETALETITNPPPEIEYLKRGQSSLVYTLEVDGHKRVIKHSRNKTLGRLLRRCLRRSRASNAWYFSHMLTEGGIAVPRPIALVEKKWGPFQIESWFVSDYVEAENLLDVWLYVPPEDWQLAEIKNLFAVMTQLKISHGDLKATNILCGDNQLLVIDFDGAREHRGHKAARLAIARDKKRFLQNWDNPALQDKLAGIVNL